jgi:acyl dehydratase
METSLNNSASEENRYLEDFAIGEKWVSDPVTVTTDDIKGFASKYDPWPLQTGEYLANDGQADGLTASVWHIASLAMREFVRARTHGNTPILGMGVDELRWLEPVRPGCVLMFQREIIDIKRSTSRPDRGTVRTQVTATNQEGAIVMKLITITRIPARAGVV